LFEETFFRGFVFKGFESGFMGPIGAVLATTGLWAAIHIQYDAYGIATVFCLGLLLGTARAMTGSLLVPLGLHATANLVATIETAVLR
jgi:membrane protease YdiL (CAAX protease family)